jgi:hypothetical protein
MLRSMNDPRSRTEPVESLQWHRTLWTMVAVQFVMSIAFSIVAPIMPLFLPDLGVVSASAALCRPAQRCVGQRNRHVVRGAGLRHFLRGHFHRAGLGQPCGPIRPQADGATINLRYRRIHVPNGDRAPASSVTNRMASLGVPSPGRDVPWA